jgi:acyl-CoA synthetase (AMP-forming)/AMP-acid ligase II
MQVHFATLWESMADAIGDCDAVICGDSRLTWSEYDDRAARLASALREFTRTKLAAFKVPKQLVVVERVHRAPNGKADYPWARNVIEEST